MAKKYLRYVSFASDPSLSKSDELKIAARWMWQSLKMFVAGFARALLVLFQRR